MSLFTLCLEKCQAVTYTVCIGDASLNELPIEHRVWHRSVDPGRVSGA